MHVCFHVLCLVILVLLPLQFHLSLDFRRHSLDSSSFQSWNGQKRYVLTHLLGQQLGMLVNGSAWHGLQKTSWSQVVQVQLITIRVNRYSSALFSSTKCKKKKNTHPLNHSLVRLFYFLFTLSGQLAFAREFVGRARHSTLLIPSRAIVAMIKSTTLFGHSFVSLSLFLSRVKQRPLLICIQNHALSFTSCKFCSIAAVHVLFDSCQIQPEAYSSKLLK